MVAPEQSGQGGLPPESVSARDAVLKAARELLSEHEGPRFSLAAVAERSGRNIALVSYHFGGKDQMLLSILREDQQALRLPLEKLAAAEIDPVAKLGRHLSGMVEVHARRPYLTALTHELLRRGDAATREIVTTEVVRPVIEFQRKLLEEGVAAGVFRPVDPFSFYLNTVGAIDMLFSARATLQFGFGERSSDPALRARFVRETLALILHGVSAHPGLIDKE